MSPEEATTNVTLRLPADLAVQIREAAEGLDRSVNWYIVEQLKRSVEPARQLGWPEQEFESSGAQFEATLDWYMPYFSTEDDNDTEIRIESALSEAAEVLHKYGAKGPVNVSRINHIGGSQLVRSITRHPDGGKVVDGSKWKGLLGLEEPEVHPDGFCSATGCGRCMDETRARYGVFDQLANNDGHDESWIVVRGWLLDDTSGANNVEFPSPYKQVDAIWCGPGKVSAQCVADEINIEARERHNRRLRMLRDLENDRGDRS